MTGLCYRQQEILLLCVQGAKQEILFVEVSKEFRRNLADNLQILNTEIENQTNQWLVPLRGLLNIETTQLKFSSLNFIVGLTTN
jgi:hypothetical protein